MRGEDTCSIAREPSKQRPYEMLSKCHPKPAALEGAHTPSVLQVTIEDGGDGWSFSKRLGTALTMTEYRAWIHSRAAIGDLVTMAFADVVLFSKRRAFLVSQIPQRIHDEMEHEMPVGGKQTRVDMTVNNHGVSSLHRNPVSCEVEPNPKLVLQKGI